MKQVNFDLEKYIDNAHFCRGKFINEFTGLEKALESFLATYFVPKSYNQSIEFMDIILDRLTFDSKRASLKSVIDILTSEGNFIKEKGKPIPNEMYFKELKMLSVHRNYFAHYLLDVPMREQEFGNVIGLMEFRDVLTVEWYNQQRYDSLIHKIKKYRDLTNEFESELISHRLKQSQ